MVVRPRSRSARSDPAIRSELAQINVAEMRAPLDSPRMAEFVAGLEHINRVAECSPGFVWRHEADHDDCPVTTTTTCHGVAVVNISTWRSYDDLHAFVYRSPHGGYVRRRVRWFVRTSTPSTALWWVTAGHRPAIEEALVRWQHLVTHGSTTTAFSPLHQFDVYGEPKARRRTRRRTR